MKIVSVIGGRLQFIKYGLLSKAPRKTHQDILIHTGRYFDYYINNIFFDELSIPIPGYNLGIGSGTYGYQTSEMLNGIEAILIKEKPDMLMLYGDTNSTPARALAAVKLHIKVAQVETGLRSFDKSMPEYINRILTVHCSGYLFLPNENIN